MIKDYDLPNYPVYPCGYDPNQDPYYFIKSAGYRMRIPGAPRLFPTVGMYVDEIFKPVPERFPDVLVGNFGTVYSIHTGMKQNPIPFEGGYLGVRTFDTDIHQTRQVGIHRLVLMAHCYVPNHRELQGNHKDGNKHNNHLSNLEWLTAQGNMDHASINDLLYHKYPKELIIAICEKLNIGLPPRRVAEELGMEYTPKLQALIGAIKYKTAYHTISDNYPNITGAANPRPNGGRQFTELQVRRICEIMSLGIPLQEVHDRYMSLYGEEIPMSFIKTLRNKPKAWGPIVDQYDIPKIRNNSTFSDKEIHMICQMLKQGYRSADIRQSLGCTNISEGSFRVLANDLQHNKSLKYSHISTQYFN